MTIPEDASVPAQPESPDASPAALPPFEYVHAPEVVLPARPERPRAVDVAFWLLITGKVISVLAILVGPLTHMRSFDIVSALIGGVVVFWLAFMMRAGKNWARIVLVVLMILGIIEVLLLVSALAVANHPVTIPAETLLVAGGIVGFVINVVALVCMYRPSARAFFRP